MCWVSPKLFRFKLLHLLGKELCISIDLLRDALWLSTLIVWRQGHLYSAKHMPALTTDIYA